MDVQRQQGQGDTPFDYLFVGAGVSALATARELCRAQPGCSIAFVDPDGAIDHDHRTFGYWFEGDSLLPEGIGRRWAGWTLESASATVEVDLGSWSYETFDITDWRAAVVEEISASAEVTWVDAAVRDVWSHKEGVATAWLSEGREVYGRWLFDSRPPDVPDGTAPVLWQSFRGWRVRADEPTFDPETLFLMDFRERDDAVQFAYVVPYDEREAFIESVVVKPSKLVTDDEFALDGLMADWTNGSWKVVDQERGQTMLTTRSFERRPGLRIIDIGLRGGAARPSTGYAFTRIEREAAELARGVAEGGNPQRTTTPRRRDQFLDAVLLELMATQPANAPDAFMALFANAPTERVLRLLDERATWTDILAIIWVLPWLIFLRAAWTLVFSKNES